MDFYSVNEDFRMSQSKKIFMHQISDKIYKCKTYEKVITKWFSFSTHFVKTLYYNMWCTTFR